MATSNQLCTGCHEKPSTLFCSCEYAPVFLCANCLPVHFCKAPQLPHQIFSVDAQGKDRNKLQRTGESFARGKAALFAEITRVDLCREEFSSVMQALLQKLEAYQNGMLSQLLNLKARLEEEANSAISEVEETMMQDAPILKTRFGPLLRSYQDDKLPPFEFHLDASAIESLIPEIFKFTYAMPELPESPTVSGPLHPLYPGANFMLPSLQQDKLSFFDLSSNSFSASFCHTKELRSVKHCSFVLVNDEQLICCGGLTNMLNPTEVVYSIEAEGIVNALAEMMYARYLHGSIYWQGDVFVFGGSRSAGPQASETTSCERLSLSADSPEWQSLPSMSVGRRRFNPCLFHDLVFLCGSSSTQIDVFDPTRLSITLLSTRLIESPSACVVFAQQDKLVVITDNQITRYEYYENSLREVSHKTHKKFVPLPSTAPFILQDIVYVISDNFCYWLSAEEGEKLGSASA